MALCGAKKRDGSSCKARAMPNGRCRMHGGTNTGAPKNNKNAVKHGIYSKSYTDEELQILEDMRLGNIDEEIRVCRIRLRRALIAEMQNAELDLVEKFEKPSILGGLPDYDEVITELRYSKKDYSPIIDRLVARIESLERTRLDLLSADTKEDGKPIELRIVRVGKDN